MTPLEHTELLAALRELREDFREDVAALGRSIDRLRADFNGRTGKIEDRVGVVESEVGKIKLWKARLEGVAFAHRWVIPVFAALAGGSISPAVILIFAHGHL